MDTSVRAHRSPCPELQTRQKGGVEDCAGGAAVGRSNFSPAPTYATRKRLSTYGLVAEGDWIRTSSTRARSIWLSPLLCRRKLGTGRCAPLSFRTARRPASKRRGPDRRGRNPADRYNSGLYIDGFNLYYGALRKTPYN